MKLGKWELWLNYILWGSEQKMLIWIIKLCICAYLYIYYANYFFLLVMKTNLKFYQANTSILKRIGFNNL